MAQVTLDIPEENIALLFEVTEAMGLSKQNILIRDESPEWHKNILNERFENYKRGESEITSWEDFEKELDSEDK